MQPQCVTLLLYVTIHLGMATEPVPAGTHPNPPRFWRGKSALTEFGFGFGFSLILKDGGGAGNGETCTHPEPVPEPAPIIFNYIIYELYIL